MSASSKVAGQKLLGLRVLIVDGDEKYAALIGAGLGLEGCKVSACQDGMCCLRRLEEKHFDAVLMNVHGPTWDGIEWTKRLRENGCRVPIVFLTELGSSEDVIRGLEAGADDCMTKPVDLGVLIATLRARTRILDGPDSGALRFADLMLDLQSRQVIRGSRRLVLTRTEFSILKCLLANLGKVVSRNIIMRSVWAGKSVSANSLDTYIRYLRRKVDVPGEVSLIHTERGVGYGLREGHR